MPSVDPFIGREIATYGPDNICHYLQPLSFLGIPVTNPDHNQSMYSLPYSCWGWIVHLLTISSIFEGTRIIDEVSLWLHMTDLLRHGCPGTWSRWLSPPPSHQCRQIHESAAFSSWSQYELLGFTNIVILALINLITNLPPALWLITTLYSSNNGDISDNRCEEQWCHFQKIFFHRRIILQLRRYQQCNWILHASFNFHLNWSFCISTHQRNRKSF